MAKIMFVISRMDVGGAERILRELAIGLAGGEKPYDVTLACLYERGRLAEGLDEKGIRVYEGVMKNRFDLTGILRFAGILRKVRPDILYIAGQALSQAAGAIGPIFVKLHGFTVVTSFITGFVQANPEPAPFIPASTPRLRSGQAGGAFWRGVKIPVKVLGFHSHDLVHRSFYALFIDKLSIYSADKIVCVSESQKRHIVINKKPAPEKIRVIYNGVDQNRFRPVPGRGSPIRHCSADVGANGVSNGASHDKVIIGTVGSLREEKGFDILLSAAPKVLMRCPTAYFVIVGEGRKRGMLEEMAKKLGISSNVSFLGERNDVEKIIPSFDIACSSSRTESFPISILEYMSCGKCVVATAVGGVPEMVKDGVNGALVKNESPEDLAEKLVYMINNKEMRESMGLMGRKIIEEYFTLDKMIENYKEFFKEIQK